MLTFGVYHFLNARELLVYIPSFLPGGIIWAYLVGVAFILVGISFITNKMVKVSGYLLAVMLLIFIVTIHIPNCLHAGEKEMRSFAFINVLKDTVIAGFAMHIAAGAHHQKLHMEDSD
jgi:uncharacterized membrane protein YkgB